MTAQLATVAAVVLAVLVPALVLWRFLRGRRDFGSPADRATFETLHTASLASPPLRGGLTPEGASRSAKHLRELLGSAAVALTDDSRLLAWDGSGDEHLPAALAHARETLDTGRTTVLGPRPVECDRLDCQIRYAVVAPLTTDERVVGTLAAYGDTASAGLVRATNEVARWVSTQVELAELDQQRSRLMEAEVRALRAQISPHFIYNSLTAIASFVRTDPERAREPLLEFADFTRYSFRRHGDFTLAAELRSIDRYLLLERARFGDRMSVTLRVAPEVLPVAVPFLCLQPLVENAVRHGLEGKDGIGHVTIVAEDVGNECRISVEDDGVGMDPDNLRRTLAGEETGDSVGLGNVDERLRTVFGDSYGIVVETAAGAGTKVSMRVPKYRVGGAGDVIGHGSGLRVLAVDDELPALEELAYLVARGRPNQCRTDSVERHRCDQGAGVRRSRRALPRHPDAGPRRTRRRPDPRSIYCASRRRLRDRVRRPRRGRLRVASR